MLFYFKCFLLLPLLCSVVITAGVKHVLKMLVVTKQRPVVNLRVLYNGFFFGGGPVVERLCSNVQPRTVRPCELWRVRTACYVNPCGTRVSHTWRADERGEVTERAQTGPPRDLAAFVPWRRVWDWQVQDVSTPPSWRLMGSLGQRGIASPGFAMD